MRCALLALLAFGAVLALSYAEEVQADDKPIDDQDVSHREARARNRQQARAEEEKSMSISDPQELAKYNSFVDALIRRLGAHFRSRSDPLTIRLASKEGASKKSTKAKKGGKSSKKSSKRKSKSSKSSSKKKGSKKGRHPKDLKIEEEEEGDEDVLPVAEEEPISRQKRDAEDEELVIELDEEEFQSLFEDVDDDESLVRVTRDLDDDDDEDDDDETDLEEDDEEDQLVRVVREAADAPAEDEVNRKGKPKNRNAKKNKSKKGSKKSKGKKSKKSGSKKSGSKKSKGGKKSNSRKSKKSKKPERSPRAVVSGFGSISRFGDVSIISRKDSREIRSAFRTGPVSVKVSKVVGSGKEKGERTAKASSAAMQGKLVIEVSKSGRALITKLNLERPQEVIVDGSLGKPGKTSNFMKKSISRASPIIAKKLKFAARDILKESSKKKS